MDGAIHSEPERPLIRTGPIELRDLGPNGRPLGTPDDCYDNSPWELHRGELVKTMSGHLIHCDVTLIVGSLFSTHARDDCMALVDIYCVLDDALGASRRAPDVVLAHEVRSTEDGPLRGIPILAVEVRAPQSKKHLDEKVKLYIEHDWPNIWLVHTERHEVEVRQKGVAPVVYRPGASVPLPPELDKYGLSAVPVNALFDKREAAKYTQEWVATRERARALLEVLPARGLDVPSYARERISSCADLDTLQGWFTLALTAKNVDDFVKGMG